MGTFCVCTMYVYTIVNRKFLHIKIYYQLTLVISKFTETMLKNFEVEYFCKNKNDKFSIFFFVFNIQLQNKNPFPIVIRRDVNRWYVAIRVTNHRR